MKSTINGQLDDGGCAPFNFDADCKRVLSLFLSQANTILRKTCKRFSRKGIDMSMEVSAKRPTEFARSVKIYLAEREIITKDSKQFSGTLKFVYDRQMDEIYVELWEANGSDPEGKSCSFTGEKKWKILGSDKVWFAYLNTPTSYQDLPAYIQNRIESKIQDSEFEFYRSENGEISMINVVIE